MDLKGSGIQLRNISPPAKWRSSRFGTEQRRKLPLYLGPDLMLETCVKPPQHQLPDMQLELHPIHSRVSASVNGFSIFAYSLRAALKRCRICTDACSSAARKAAFSAMLRI